MQRHETRLLTAYIHDELPPHLRERVARHVQDCDRCYADMCRERELARTLEARMPALGAPRPDQLARLLPGILAETAPGGSMRPPSRLPGFGLALVVSLVAIMLVPALVMPRVAAVSAPDQPAPYMIAATATQSVTDSPELMVLGSPTAVAARADVATEPPTLEPPPAPVLQATPMR